MSNGHFCCLVGACCDPDGQRAALAKKLAALSGGTYSADELKAVSGGLLDEFDLVPKGVGAAIATGYQPMFKEFVK